MKFQTADSRLENEIEVTHKCQGPNLPLGSGMLEEILWHGDNTTSDQQLLLPCSPGNSAEEGN